MAAESLLHQPITMLASMGRKHHCAHLQAHHLESSHFLGMCIGIGTIWEQAGIIAMHHIVDVVLGE